MQVSLTWKEFIWSSALQQHLEFHADNFWVFSWVPECVPISQNFPDFFSRYIQLYGFIFLHFYVFHLQKWFSNPSKTAKLCLVNQISNNQPYAHFSIPTLSSTLNQMMNIPTSCPVILSPDPTLPFCHLLVTLVLFKFRGSLYFIFWYINIVFDLNYFFYYKKMTCVSFPEGIQLKKYFLDLCLKVFM